MPSVICGICQATIDKDKTADGATIISTCLGCSRELAAETRVPCPQRPAMQKFFPIYQEGLRAFQGKADHR